MLRLPGLPPVVPVELPGKLRARLREGVAPTPETLLADEAEGRDNLIEPKLFEALAAQPLVQVEWSGWYGPPNRFPLIHTDVSMVSAAFAVPLATLRPLLPPTTRLTPARITPWHGVLLVSANHVHRGGLGRYQELSIATPMFLDTPRRLPAWSLLREALRGGQDPALGLFTLESAVDRVRARDVGVQLYGLPRQLAHAEFALGSQTGLASMEADGHRLAALEVSAPRSYLQWHMDLSFNSFSILQGQVLRSRCAAVGEGYRGARGSAKVEFGDHPAYQRFGKLPLLARPMETRVCARLNWIVGTPELLGPA
ncbi:hypothetical protein D0B54_11280 [Solimonas sp. K1W22B-7]|uniref:hypothetical protein n=1 Tax=Solimonas sp. K1W22B-7 TaxID=2303331 RepID=UPI000E332287|nr:hypothetical protein [Solimonas sp. K1W22B-7]AXQ29234.1 hypothetical protein D0B54_11280 [Solimonas sp. K1W22B-7]